MKNWLGKVNWKEMGKAFLIILLYLVIVPTILEIVLMPLLKKYNGNIIFATIVNTLVYVINLIIVLFIYRKSIKKEFEIYRKNFKSNFKLALKCWGKGYLLMILVNFVLIQLLGTMAANEQNNRDILAQLPVFSVLAMVIFGPILEEFAFRKGFRKVFNSRKAFLIFTALLFGSMHIISSLNVNSLTTLNGWGQLLYILPYSILGYFFGMAYYDSDSIFTSITCHILHNGLAVCFIMLLQGLM